MPPMNQLKNIKYDHLTGQFFKLFTNTRKKTKRWRKIGSVNKRGYLVVKHKCISYLAHRLAYYMYYKIDPKQYDIDHINGNKLDNRIDNLRLSTTSQNCFNSKAKSSNKTGYKGVCKGNSGYTAQIYINGRKHHLGTYKNPFYAFLQYCKAAKRLHKEFRKYI
jgi:hypothetical protein